MTDQNNTIVTATPITRDTRAGTKRLTLVDTKRSVSRKSRASATRTAKVASAINPTSNGCAVSTGGMPISSRIEFCHCAACQRKSAAMSAKPMAAPTLATRINAALGRGNPM